MLSMTRPLATLALTALVLGVSPLPAHAGQGHGKGNPHKEYRFIDNEARRVLAPARSDERAGAIMAIGRNDRSIIRDYLARTHGRNCPPGLARKNNGCLPPGIAKKYAVGEVLGPGVVFYPLPGDLLRRLGPVPAGYRYVRVDQDVLLIAEASKKVIDAVTLLSAVGG